MAKFLAQIIVAGTQIVARAFARAVREEIAASQDAARRLGGHRSRAERAANVKLGLSLDEAKQILNVSEMNREEINRRYEHLFKTNEKTSFYLQSKVFRAKERLDMEFADAEQQKDDQDGKPESPPPGEKT